MIRGVRRACAIAGLLGLASSAGTLQAQLAAGGAFAARDSAGLGGTYGTLRMLLERTFLRVDVLAVEVRIDAAAAARIAAVAADGDLSPADRDTIATAALEAHEVWARMTWRRDVGIDRVVSEIRRSMENAVDAGVLPRAQFNSIAGMLHDWYAPLAERGVKDGDVQFYRVRGDTLRTLFLGRDGRTYIETEGIGPAHRRALLGSWFARGSDFRDGLVRSVVENRGGW